MNDTLDLDWGDSEVDPQRCAADGCERTDLVSHGFCGKHRQSRNRLNGGLCYVKGCGRFRTKGANHGFCREHLDEHLATRICVADGCGELATAGAAGMCSTCYRAMLRDRRDAEAVLCAIDGCERIAAIDRTSLCEPHHRRMVAEESRTRTWPMILEGSVEPKRHFLTNGYVQLVYQGFRELEHRVVMARAIGRRLYDHENVHHRNGNRADNRFENLEMWTRPQLQGIRVLDLVSEAERILTTYKPMSLTTVYLANQVLMGNSMDEAA